ncbi:MAG: amidohydrolase family protein [Novosphingobium sp.]
MTKRLSAGHYAAAVLFAALAPASLAAREKAECLFNDSHFHLTNYVQEGISVEDYLKIMDGKVCRSTLFGIPLQQMWDYNNTGDRAPTYYLNTDAPLYYYSFTDAYIAQQYLAMKPAVRARFDPMITGFNPSDMYAADHIRRVLQTYPGVFTGIGEFSIHKEFVSPKVSGITASLTSKALDRLLDFAGEVGLVVLLHNDADVPFSKGDKIPTEWLQMRDLLHRHPNTTIIWAHTGLGRVVKPSQLTGSDGPGGRPDDHLDFLETFLSDPKMRNVYFDISWDEVAKYAVSSPQTIERTAQLLNRYPDRFLFGTDNVAPASAEAHFKVFDMWAPVFAKLTPEASHAVRLGNYERIFDEGRRRVRAWEAANVKTQTGKR